MLSGLAGCSGWWSGRMNLVLHRPCISSGGMGSLLLVSKWLRTNIPVAVLFLKFLEFYVRSMGFGFRDSELISTVSGSLTFKFEELKSARSEDLNESDSFHLVCSTQPPKHMFTLQSDFFIPPLKGISNVFRWFMFVLCFYTEGKVYCRGR